MNSKKHFAIRFDDWYRILSSALLLRPSDSFVEVDENEVSVRMGWAFRARFPRSSIESTEVLEKKPLSRGVHGFLGRWLVNGSGDGVVALNLRPRQRASTVGIPIRLRRLMVSVDDPRAFTEALRAA
jgi:hypothetical protein